MTNPAGQSDKYQDYSGFFGRNIISEESDEKCPFKEIPKDPKDYAIYRKYWESEVESAVGMLNSGLLKCSAKCEARDPKSGNCIKCNPPKKGHMGAGFVAACDHVIVQDPVSPEGAYFVPYEFGGESGFIICKTCFTLMEKHKLDFEKNIHVKCVLCMQEALEAIIRLKPDRFVDLRNKI